MPGKLIDELSVYYELAIRRNTDSVENMHKEIYATLYHKISTDEKPQHDRWQNAKASHTFDIYTYKPAMPMQIFDAVQNIYEDLTREDLLSLPQWIYLKCQRKSKCRRLVYCTERIIQFFHGSQLTLN